MLIQRGTVTVDLFKRPEEFRDYFKANYGPTIAAYKANAEKPERIASLDRDLVELVRQNDHGNEATVMEWEYLLLTARR